VPSLREKLLSILLEPKLRPWALLTPLLVLLLALPLLRPLVAPMDVSLQEKQILATVQSIVSGNGLRLDPAEWRGVEGTYSSGAEVYAARPPMFAVLLAGPAWVIDRAGVDFRTHESLAVYLLTLIGVTLPTAVGAGMIYRMGRLFELTRPQRALLAVCCALSAGWLSYATVINVHAPATALLLCACACVLYVAAAKKPINVVWLMLLAGALGALAATVDPWTLPIVLPLPLVVLAMRWTLRDRIVAIGLLTLGMIPIAWIHCAWSLAAFNSVIPPTSTATLADVAGLSTVATPAERLVDLLGRLFTVLIGRHGLFIHFPLLIAGVVGLFIVLRRHWPSHAKMLAAITFVGAVTIVMLVSTRDAGLDGRMFAVKWFVVFAPLVMFWLGAVIRRSLGWQLKLTLVMLGLIGTVATVAGARNPMPTVPYDGITAIGAMQRWSSVAPATFDRTKLAERTGGR
jgi:4-amino-4-deoxy-L-arabinose transferase-like glycosyltransferase